MPKQYNNWELEHPRSAGPCVCGDTPAPEPVFKAPRIELTTEDWDNGNFTTVTTVVFEEQPEFPITAVTITQRLGPPEPTWQTNTVLVPQDVTLDELKVPSTVVWDVDKVGWIYEIKLKFHSGDKETEWSNLMSVTIPPLP